MFAPSRRHLYAAGRNSIKKVLLQCSSTRAPNTVFIEKDAEDPVVILSQENDVDLIGPPDAVSNLRPILRKRLINETALQTRLREMQDATQVWNHQFWAKHNANFVQERQQYIAAKNSDHHLTADEMSEFYKEFLDKYWKTHLNYNIEWYKKNFILLYLAAQVQMEIFLHRLV